MSFNVTLPRIRQAAASPLCSAIFLAAVAAVYILAYLQHPARPGNSIYPEGWFGWWDQGHYLKCTASIAQGAITKETYIYPLGYSLVAVPFYFFTAVHPFFLPNLIFVLGSVWTFFSIARRVLPPIEAYALIVAFAVFYRGMLSESLVVPWNTIPTQFLLYAILYFTAFKRPAVRDVYLAIGCLSILYVFKVVEFVCAVPLVGIAILRLGDRRQIFRAGSLAIVAIGSVIVAMMFIHQAVFGQIWSSYELNQRRIGLGAYPFLRKLYLLFISGGPVFRESHPMLLSHVPWLLLVVPGIVYLWQRFGIEFVGLLLSFALCLGLYVSYNDLGPGNLFRYSLIHYFAWLLPLLALITYVGLRDARKTRLGRWSFCSVPVLLILLCSVTLREKIVGSYVPDDARVLSIPQATDRSIDWVLLHGAKAVPAMTTNGIPWRIATDFQYGIRLDGYSIFPSRHVTGRPFEITPANIQDVRRVDYGELVWRFRWSPQWLIYQWTRRFTRPRISLLGQQTGVDLAGPSGLPDGAPDQVITVELPSWAMTQIKDWEIELPDNRGHWFTSLNTLGAWQITTDFPPALQAGGRDHVARLCFPDNGNVDATPLVHIRGLDSMGQLVVESDARR